VSDLVARRQLNRGYNDGFARAVEIVATPLVFGLIGSLADRWLGTRPLLTIGLAVFAVVGIFAKLWLGYDRQMRDYESGAVWSRRRVASIATGVPASVLDTVVPAPPSASAPAPAAETSPASPVPPNEATPSDRRGPA
jgi:hypothetical protein